MIRVCFQNGPDAQAIVLEEQFEVRPTDARLEAMRHAYATRPGAVIWIEGEDKPEHFPAESKPAAKAKAKAE